MRPEPPADLWERMDETLEQDKRERTERKRGFTAAEYAKRYGVAQSTARYKLRDLLKRGKIITLGKQSLYVTGGRVTIYDFPDAK